MPPRTSPPTWLLPALLMICGPLAAQTAPTAPAADTSEPDPEVDMYGYTTQKNQDTHNSSP